MFTIIAIFGFFFTYTLIYKYALSIMLRHREDLSPDSHTQVKPAADIG